MMENIERENIEREKEERKKYRKEKKVVRGRYNGTSKYFSFDWLLSFNVLIIQSKIY